MKSYKCENPACSLGAVGEPGTFTGGISAEQAHLLTGAPLENVTHGDGYCPNCGKPGKETK
jgi:hypothetical protein